MAENLPPVIGDDQMAAQVLANLLSNAARFSPDDTPVEVEVEYARERMFTTITDQGPGIPDDDRERIFEKFTRLDGTWPSRAGCRTRSLHRAPVGRGHGRHDLGRRRPGRRFRVLVHPPGGTGEGQAQRRQDSVIVTLLIVTGGFGAESPAGAVARIC